ncbi:MAG: hypothetical protein AMS27_01250 [Bacteroides sp. SM23_62_1]|nr:MAG: hypothetical protein AMS27_01250 [Bacteroides sp. SM23_62_1]
MHNHLSSRRLRPGSWILTILFLAFIQPVLSQQRMITGVVTHSVTGEPLSGVSVDVTGTTVGTVTDETGRYILYVPEDTRILLFKLPGMQILEEPMDDRGIIDVVMGPDILGKDNEIVTAFGRIKKKKTLGYAIQDVFGEIISQSNEPNVVNALQGRVAGVQVTNADGGVASGARIIIRGLSSLTVESDNQPLFIVDGVPVSNEYSQPDQWGGMDYGNAIMDLNPADIENISVLKSANAAALYGSRALNGVVLVTTKTGKSPGQRGVGVTFESGWLWDRPLVIPAFQDKYGQGMVGQFAYVAGDYSGLNDGVDESWGPPLDYIVKGQDLLPGGKLSWTDTWWYGDIHQTAGKLLALPQWDSPYNPETGVRTPTPWVSHPDNVKNFFETGHRITQNLAFQGSADNGHFRLSYSNLDIKGTIPNTDLKKNTVSLNAGYNLSHRLKTGGSVIYISNRSNNIVQSGYTDGNPIYSIGQWFGRQVNMQNLHDLAGQTDPVTGYPMNWNHSYHSNPYWVVHHNTNSRNRDRIIGNLNLDYMFTNWLSLKVILGNDWYIEDRKERTAHWTIGDRQGAFWAGSYRRNELNATGAFTFNKSFGSDIHIAASLGGELNKYDYQYHSTSIADLIVPDLYAVSNAAVAAETGLEETHMELQSVYGSLDLGFRNFLYLDLTGRNDWSSTLPASDNSCFYPSVSLGFILTEVLPFQSVVLPFMKFRASYAEAGGLASPYQLQGIYERSESFDGSPVVTYSDIRPLHKLKPRHKKSIETGVEMKFMNNRLGMDATWYKENTINQIVDIRVSGQTGFNYQSVNAGELQSMGVELIVYATPVKTTYFSWGIMASWSCNENLVVELYEDMQYFNLYSGTWQAQIHARPGEEYGILWGYGIVRENQEKVYYDEDKTQLSHILYSGRPVITTEGLYIQSENRTDLGNVYPDWFGGVSNVFSFRNINASFLIDFRKGGVIYSVTDWFGHYSGVLEATAAVNDRGVNIRESVDDEGGIKVEGVYGYLDASGDVKFTDANGIDTGYPVDNQTYARAEQFYHDYWGKTELSVFNASFIKLRELSVGYTFSNIPILQRAGIRDINLSLLGRNLWIIYKNTPDIDPEMGIGAGNYVGIETNVIPSVRSMGFNVKVNF